jgi:hypothetical protein
MSTVKSQRRLAITKRVSLADVSEGWQDCYALIRPCSYQEYSGFADMDTTKMTVAEQIKYAMDFAASHFVSGKVKVEGTDSLVDMTTADIYESTELSDLLFAEIVGLKLDPKATGTAA